MTARERFQADHAGDRSFLDAVQHELDRQISDRVNAVMANPSDYHLRFLGPVPAEPEHQAIWKRGATILEADDLGIGTDPAGPKRPSLLGSRQDAAEMRARLEVMTIPREQEGVSHSIEHDLGLELGL